MDLQHRDPSGRRRSDDIRASSLCLGAPLLDRGDLVAQRLDLARGLCRQLLQRMLCLRELVLLLGQLPAQRHQILPLLQQRIFPAPALHRRHIAFRQQLPCSRDQALGDPDALGLDLDLSAYIADFGFAAGDKRIQALALGRGGPLFGRDLAFQHILLMPHRGEFRRVNVLAVGCDLRSGDREQRIAGLDVLPFLDVEVADDAFARREYLHRAGSRDQKAGTVCLRENCAKHRKTIATTTTAVSSQASSLVETGCSSAISPKSRCPR